MDDTRYMYTPCHVDVVTLGPSEQITFTQEVLSASFGVFYFEGHTTMLEGPVTGRVFNTVGAWRSNASAGWCNDIVGLGDGTFEAAPEGCRWLCMSDNGSGRREVQHLRVSSAAVVPAGWGFVVATGSVTFEGKTANQFAYVKPRTADFEVVGVADLLLVR